MGTSLGTENICLFFTVYEIYLLKKALKAE